MSRVTELLKEHLEKNENAINKLAEEVTAARKLLWATIYVNGSEVRIPDHVMKMTENDQELECSYDFQKRETVLRSKVSIPQFKASSTAPDKDECPDVLNDFPGITRLRT